MPALSLAHGIESNRAYHAQKAAIRNRPDPPDVRKTPKWDPDIDRMGALKRKARHDDPGVFDERHLHRKPVIVPMQECDINFRLLAGLSENAADELQRPRRVQLLYTKCSALLWADAFKQVALTSSIRSRHCERLR